MKVLVFPKDNNPYQNFLYSSMPDTVKISYLDTRVKDKISTLTFLPRILFTLICYRAKGYRILHIHWLYPLAVGTHIPFHKHLGYLYTNIFLMMVKLLRYKVIWTVHNVMPHSILTINDIAIRRRLARLASAKILHSSEACLQLKQLSLDTSNTHTLGIGSYEDLYPNNISRKEARNKLRISDRTRVLLYFGTIYDYKNIPYLLATYKEVLHSIPDSLLIIAGKNKDSNTNLAFAKYKNEYGDRLLIVDKYIEDSEIQLYFNAADATVYPFKSITTSSSVLLAGAFNKPIIAPYIGAIKDIPSSVGIIYDPLKPDALREAITSMLKASSDQKNIMSKASAAYSASLSWNEIAHKTVQIYERILMR